MNSVAATALTMVLSMPIAHASSTDECLAYLSALKAFQATGEDFSSDEWDTLLEASEAVNSAIKDEDAANALNRLWELRRARSFATVALGLWAYPFDRDPLPPDMKEIIQEMHRRVQRLSYEMQDIYRTVAMVACSAED